MDCDFGEKRGRECELKAEDAQAAIERRGRLTRSVLRLSSLLHHPANENKTLAEILKLDLEQYCGSCEFANLKAPGAAPQPGERFVLHAVPEVADPPPDPVEPIEAAGMAPAEDDNVVVFANFGTR